MSTENSCTVRFLWPPPASAIPQLQALFTTQGFGEDWDEPAVDLEHLKCPPGGTVTFRARDVPYADQRELVAIAQKFQFSLLVHTDWHKDYESEIAGSIYAYDAADGRVIDCGACKNAILPALDLDDALAHTKEDLQRLYGLPKDLV